jgi:hypothetical protein
MVRPDIHTRPEFDRLLQEALVKMRALVQKVPDPVLKAVLRQLEAVEQWTAGGQNLTKAQKDRLVMGLQASREMADFEDEQDLIFTLYNYIIREMPTAPPP